MKSRRRDPEMVRQVPLQWPGAIPRLRPVDCSATPSYSMKWRSHADHGQKHETGDWMHSELDDHGPLQKQRNREFDSPQWQARLGAWSGGPSCDGETADGARQVFGALTKASRSYVAIMASAHRFHISGTGRRGRHGRTAGRS